MKDERVINLLTELSESYRLAVVTNNGTKYAEKILDYLGIKGFFEAVLTQEECGVGKPDAFIYMKIAELLGVSPDECVSIGDRRAHDIIPAVHVGMRGIEIEDGKSLPNVKEQIRQIEKELSIYAAGQYPNFQKVSALFRRHESQISAELTGYYCAKASQLFWSKLRTDKRIERQAIEFITEIAISENQEKAQIGSTILFEEIVERLFDSFSREDRLVFYEIFAQVLSICREKSNGAMLGEMLKKYGLKSEDDLIRRVELIFGRKPYSWNKKKREGVSKVIIPTRVTIGADIAITSIAIERAKELFPSAEIVFLCNPRIKNLFSGDPKVRTVDYLYRRRGTLVERLEDTIQACNIVSKETKGIKNYVIIDPNSRVFQTGMIPCTAETERYYYLQDTLRDDEVETVRSHCQNVNFWFDENFGGRGGITLPRVYLTQEAKDFASSIKEKFKLNTQHLISISFGFGGNDAKRVGGNFEIRLPERLIENTPYPRTLLLEIGIHASERRQADSILQNLVANKKRVVRITAEEGEYMIELWYGDSESPDIGKPDLKATVKDISEFIYRDENWRPDLIAFHADLGNTAAIYGMCHQYIGYDSKGQHIAAALGTPSITLFTDFGSLYFTKRWTPSGPNARKTVLVDNQRVISGEESIENTIEHVVSNLEPRRTKSKYAFIAVDAGGTKVEIAIIGVDEDGELTMTSEEIPEILSVKTIEVATLKDKGYKNFYATISDAINEAKQEARQSDLSVLDIVLMGTAGSLIYENGELVFDDDGSTKKFGTKDNSTTMNTAERYQQQKRGFFGVSPERELRKSMNISSIVVQNDGPVQMLWGMNALMEDDEFRTNLLGKTVAYLGIGTGLGGAFAEIKNNGQIELFSDHHISVFKVIGYKEEGQRLAFRFQLDNKGMEVDIPCPASVKATNILSGKVIREIACAVDRLFIAEGQEPIFLPIARRDYAELTRRELNDLIKEENEDSPVNAQLINERILKGDKRNQYVKRAYSVALQLAQYEGEMLGRIIHTIYSGDIQKATGRQWSTKDTERVRRTTTYILGGSIGVNNPINGIIIRSALQYLDKKVPGVDFYIMPIEKMEKHAGTLGAFYLIDREEMVKEIQRVKEGNRVVSDTPVVDRLESPRYGIELQRDNLKRAISDPTQYYDVVTIAVKSASAPYIMEELSSLRGRVMPESSQIIMCSSSRDSMLRLKNFFIERQLENKREPVIIVYVLDQNIEMPFSAVIQILHTLHQASFDFKKTTSAIVLSGGKGARGYPVTIAGGIDNKGLVKSIDGRSNIHRALTQILQFYQPQSPGIIISPVDRIVSISQLLSEFRRKDVQLFGSTVSADFPELAQHGKVKIDSDGSLLRLFKKESPEEELFMRFKEEVAINNLSILYLSPKAISAVVKKHLEDIYYQRRDLDIHQDLLKKRAVFSDLSFGYIDTGRGTLSANLNTSRDYYEEIQRLFRDDVLRALVGVRLDSNGVLIGEDVQLGENVIVEHGATILGRSKISKGIIRAGGVIIDSIIEDVDVENESMIVAVEERSEKQVHSGRGELVCDVRIIEKDNTRSKIRLICSLDLAPKEIWNEHRWPGGYSFEELSHVLDHEAISQFLRSSSSHDFRLLVEDAIDLSRGLGEFSRLLYALDNPRVRNLLTDLMTFGYGQFGIEYAEVKEMIDILHYYRDDLAQARQELYDAGFDWLREGTRYYGIYRNYKTTVRYNTTFTLIRDHIEEGDIIADVGCGDDKLGRIIVENIENTSVIGTDVVDYRGTGYEGHERVDFILQEDSDKIPLPDNSVDKVLFSAVFHHASSETTDKLLAEARRVLRPNGRIIIIEDVVLESVPPRNNEENLVDKFKELTDEERKSVISIFDWHANHVVVGVTEIPMAFNYQTEEEWDQTFACAGFEVETKDFVGIYRDKFHPHPHTVFVLRKSAKEKTTGPKVDKSNPAFAFEHMPVGVFTLRQYCEETDVPLSTARRDFNILEQLGLLSIHRGSGGKPNEIESSVPDELRAGILKILKSYRNKRDLPKTAEMILDVLEDFETEIGHSLLTFNPHILEIWNIKQSILAFDIFYKRVIPLINESYLDSHQKQELIKILEYLFYKSLPYMLRDKESNPVHHHLFVLHAILRISFGEGYSYRSVRNAAVLGLLHDVGYAYAKAEKVKKDQIHTVNDIQRAIAARREHMDLGKDIARSLLAELNVEFGDIFAEDDIDSICRVVGIHDNSSIEEYAHMKEGFRYIFPFATGTHLIPKDDILAKVLREADRVWMISREGLEKDLVGDLGKGKEANFNEKLRHNIKRHKEEYMLYEKAFESKVDDYGFKEKTKVC